MKELLLAAFLILQGPEATPGTGVVEGRLVYADGTAVNSQLVRLAPVASTGRPQPYRSFTDVDGNFRVRNVPAGRYFLRAELGTPNPVFYPGVKTEAEATAVTVEAGATVVGVHFALPASESGVKISGRVALPPGSPTVMRRLVELSCCKETELAPDGTFEFAHIQPGSYSLIVDPAPGMRPVPFSVTNTDVAGIELVIPPLLPVTGNVTVEGGGVPPRLMLVLDGNPVYRTNVATVPDGRFEPLSLPEGQYRATFNTLPAGYYLKSMTAGGTDLVTNPLKQASVPTRVAIVLGRSPGVRVAGTVKGTLAADTASTFSKKIVLAGTVVNETAEAPINPDGTFEFPRVTPGFYVARVALTATVGAPVVPVTIPAKDVTGIEIPTPGLVEVTGRVAVEGNGLPPKFSLLLVRNSKANLVAASPDELPKLAAAQDAQSLQLLVRSAATSPDGQILQVDVNALPDGSFKLKLPEGDYRVTANPASSAIPPAYFLRSLSYGAARLFTEPMHVSEKDPADLQVNFGTTEANPWVKVSGRVAGGDPAQAPFRVALEGDITATAEALVNPDGTFEFPRVLKSTAYTARLLPFHTFAPAPRITVTDQDVSMVEILVPSEKEVLVRGFVEGNASVPGFALSLAGSATSTTVVVKPEQGGTVRIKLPQDERRVRVTGLPFGYEVKSMTYGGVDLLKEQLRINRLDSSELRVEFAADSEIPSGSLRGRVTGLDPNAGPVQIALTGVSSYARYETEVNADGSFYFQKIAQGTYMPSLLGGLVAERITPAAIVVTASDLSVVEIAAPRQGNTAPRVAAESATGARVVDLGGGSRESANESAAVANLRTINTALVTYLSASRGNYGNIQNLIDAGLLDNTFNGIKAGFMFSIIARGSDYVAVAVPAASDSGRYAYFSVPDAVVRFATIESLAPPRQGGNAVQ